MPFVAKKSLSGRNRTSDPVIALNYSHMLYQLSYAELQSPMAQSVARQAVNLQVAGSNPAGGAFFSNKEKRGRSEEGVFFPNGKVGRLQLPQ